jgi:hypothetical protein
MSYDLSLRPTPGDDTPRPSRERVAAVLVNAGARARGASPPIFVSGHSSEDET